jgi:hypothetical protein
LIQKAIDFFRGRSSSAYYLLAAFASVVSDPVIKPPLPHPLWSGQYDLVTQPPPLSKRAFSSVSTSVS